MGEQKLIELEQRLQVLEFKTKTIPPNMTMEQAIHEFSAEASVMGMRPSDIIEVRSMLRALSESGSGRIFRYGLIHTLAWPISGLAALISKVSEKLLARMKASEQPVVEPATGTAA